MQDRYLKTGIFLAPFHPLGENPTLALDRDMQLVEHLDRLGYHEAWIGEHHSGGFEIIACPELFIAAAAERTKHIRLGTGVVSLPYHNPFILASRVQQLDHMTRGRAMLGMGPGALVHDAAKIGIRAEDQRRRMNEAIDVVIPLLRGETVTRKTDWFDLADAHVQLQSYSQPEFEMAVACSRSPVGVVAAGRHGIGLLPIGGTSPVAMQAHANNWQIYETSAREHGHVPERNKWRIVTFAHVAETREQARRDVEFGIHDFAAYFRDVATFPIIPRDVTDPVGYVIDEGLACIGTPEDCIGHFERLWEASNGFGAVLLLAQNWADWPATLRSYELMARFVHPHFQRSSNAARRTSYDRARANQDTHVPDASRAVAGEIERYQQSRKAAGD